MKRHYKTASDNADAGIKDVAWTKARVDAAARKRFDPARLHLMPMARIKLFAREINGGELPFEGDDKLKLLEWVKGKLKERKRL